MILGFKKQFVEPIKNGTKIHTIRKDNHRRWKAGNKIHFYTGIRTKEMKCFGKLTCISVQSIVIKYENKCSDYPVVVIDGKTHLIAHRPNIILQLAMNDGFKNVKDFLKWFDKDFSGMLIHWTDLKY